MRLLALPGELHPHSIIAGAILPATCIIIAKPSANVNCFFEKIAAGPARRLRRTGGRPGP